MHVLYRSSSRTRITIVNRHRLICSTSSIGNAQNYLDRSLEWESKNRQPKNREKVVFLFFFVFLSLFLFFFYYVKLKIFVTRLVVLFRKRNQISVWQAERGDWRDCFKLIYVNCAYFTQYIYICNMVYRAWRNLCTYSGSGSPSASHSITNCLSLSLPTCATLKSTSSVGGCLVNRGGELSRGREKDQEECERYSVQKSRYSM